MRSGMFTRYLLYMQIHDTLVQMWVCAMGIYAFLAMSSSIISDTPEPLGEGVWK